MTEKIYIHCPDCKGKGYMKATSLPNSWDEMCRRCNGRGVIRDKNQPERKKGMNYSTAVMLVNENIRAIYVSYEVNSEGKGLKPYTMFKTLDHSIKVGESVVVPTSTRHKHTVVRVEEVDVDVDFEDNTPVQWITDKVDTSKNEQILAEELKWIDALKLSEKKSKKDEIRKKLLATYEGDVDISRLAITQVSDVTALEHKPVEEVADKK
jgi:hypothetical protein